MNLFLKKMLVIIGISNSCLLAKSTGVNQLLKKVSKQTYQDIIINGRTIKKGAHNCALRYTTLKKILDLYQRPFTLLDIGASEGYFSLRAATNYDCTCVMIESHKEKLLPLICKLNKNLNNIVVLEKYITPDNLHKLGHCEHFDVVLALNLVHQMKNQWKEMIDALLTLGDNIVIQVPAPVKLTDNILVLIEQYLRQQKKGTVIGLVRQSRQKYSKLYWLQAQRNNLTKTVWAASGNCHYIIKSTFSEKSLYKPRMNKTTSWIKGINLWTFKHLNGVYPELDTIKQEIKRLAHFAHTDFLPWNIVVQGNNLELIDWDDFISPGYQHNYDACLKYYLS